MAGKIQYTELIKKQESFMLAILKYKFT